jgi:hypothetical protein
MDNDFSVLQAMAEIPPYDNVVWIKFVTEDPNSIPRIKTYELDKDTYIGSSFTNNKVYLNLQNKRGSLGFASWLTDITERERSICDKLSFEMVLSNYHGNIMSVNCDFKGVEYEWDFNCIQFILHAKRGIKVAYSAMEEEFEYITLVENK